MKWNILHESRGRIRLHLRKPRMSLAEADQLQDYLTNLPGVRTAAVYERTCDGVILGGALLVDLPGVGQDVAAVLLQGGGGLHDLVLHAQDSGGALGIQFLRILAGQNLNTGGAKQSAACKQTNLCPIHSSNPLYCNMLAMVYKMCPIGRTYKVYS